MSDHEPRGKLFSPGAEDVTFYGRTNKAMVHKDAQGNVVPMRLTATGSSDLYDLVGDRMMPSMLEDMRAFEEGRIIFSNHAYSLPKNAIGRLAAAPHIESVQATKTTPFVEAGQNYLEMVFTFDILPNNAEAVQIYEYIHEYNLTVGTSVGVQITDYSITRDEDGWPVSLDIEHGILLEVSTVGIPCNYQSWVKSARVGLQKQYGAPLPFDEPKELRYMARHWGDMSVDIDQLVLSRIHKSMHVKQLDFVDFDAEDRVSLTNLDAILRSAGLYIERLPATA